MTNKELKKRNPVAEALALDRKWGYAIKDKKKYSRSQKDRELEEEVEIGLEEYQEEEN